MPRNLLTLVAVGLIVIGARTATGQADFEKGYQGYQSFHGSDFDNVNLANGNLVLDIPLLSYPQRGGLPPVVLSIRSNGTTFQSDPPFLNGPQDTKQHEVAGGITGAPWGQPHVVIDPGGLNWREERVTTASHTANGGPEYLVRFVAIDESGATHSLGGSIANTVAAEVPGIRYTVDGSGLMLQPGTALSGPILVDRKGNVGGMVDPHGNALKLQGQCARAAGTGDFFNPSLAEWEGYAHGTASATSIVDSVGRVIPNPTYLQPAVADSCLVDLDASYHPAHPDVNGCETYQYPSNSPTGTATVPGAASGPTVPLTFCYQQIPIGGQNTAIPTPLPVGTPIPNGGTSTNACAQQLTAQGQSMSCEPINESWWVLTSVTLPNSTQWKFAYTTYGQVASVTMPTGAVVSYTYGTRLACGNPPGQVPVTGTPSWPFSNLMSSQKVISRTLDTKDGTAPKVWTYANTIGSGWAGSPNSGTVTVTGPAASTDPSAPYGSDTVHIFSLIDGSVCGPYETQTQYYEGTGSSRTELKQVDTRYNDTGADFANPTNFSNYIVTGVLPQTVTTTMLGGSPVERQDSDVYDRFGTYEDYTGLTHRFSLGQLLSSTESDWVAGSVAPTQNPAYLPTVPSLTPLRSSLTTNLWQSSWHYYAANMIDLPCLETTFSGPSTVTQGTCSAPSVPNNQASQTSFAYDQPSFLTSPPATPVFGDLTSVTRWWQGGSVPIVTSTSYTAYGMPYQKFDAKGTAVVTIAYDSTNMFPDKLTYPNQTYEQPTYDANTGLLKSNLDVNDQPTNYTYDSMRRLTSVGYADGGSESYAYYDSTTSTPYFKFTKLLNPGTYTATGFADGLGRMTGTQVTSAPEGPISKTTTYDQLGRVASVTNPNLGEANGIVSYQYDALGRKTYQCQQDNTPVNSATCTPTNSFLHWTYQGNVVNSYDENSNLWVRTTDGLGRLTKVTEPGVLNTTYSYDVLGNLKCANQWGTSTPQTSCTSSLNRQFNYDTLSRLTSSKNPETGTISYVYSVGSTLCSGDVSALCSKTDARSVTTNFTYDIRNRLTGKSYTGDSTGTATSCYQYGTNGSTGNGADRLINAWTQSGICPTTLGTGYFALRSFKYDGLGRVLSEQQCTRSNCGATNYPITYIYDLAGNLITHTNGMASSSSNLQTFTNCYDSANRLLAVALGTLNCFSAPTTPTPATLFSSPTYTPFGGLAGATFGSGLQLNRTYDLRLRITGETDAGTTNQTATPGAVIKIVGLTDQ